VAFVENTDAKPPIPKTQPQSRDPRRQATAARGVDAPCDLQRGKGERLAGELAFLVERRNEKERKRETERQET
jgi:hypothetical protein